MFLQKLMYQNLSNYNLCLCYQKTKNHAKIYLQIYLLLFWQYLLLIFLYLLLNTYLHLLFYCLYDITLFLYNILFLLHKVSKILLFLYYHLHLNILLKNYTFPFSLRLLRIRKLELYFSFLSKIASDSKGDTIKSFARMLLITVSFIAADNAYFPLL